MGEQRYNIKQNMRTVKLTVIISFFFLLAILLLSVFARFGFFVSGYGNITNRMEVAVRIEKSGTLVKKFVRDGQNVLEGQKILSLKKPNQDIEFVLAPVSGQFLELDEDNLQTGREVSLSEICGMIVRQGLFLKADIDEKDILDVKPGQKCYVRILSVDKYKETSVLGRVYYVSDSPRIENQKVFYSVYCTMDDDYFSEKSLKIAMSGRVKIRVRRSTVFDALLGRRDE